MTEHSNKLSAALYDLGLSRRFEHEAGNVEAIWLIGPPALDHKSVNDFRKDEGSASGL
ncbi:hypothetical protein [Bradyrhizobium sp. JR3.5]